MCVPVRSKDLDFQRYMSLSCLCSVSSAESWLFREFRWELIVPWVQVRVDCSVSSGESWLFREFRWELIVLWVQVRVDCSVSSGESWLFCEFRWELIVLWVQVRVDCSFLLILVEWLKISRMLSLCYIELLKKHI
jgi:hypothetical protein